MEYLLTANEAKYIDNTTINETGLPDIVLMERAALGVADEIILREGLEKEVIVVCGSGNNGADGICVGRILFERGYNVTLALVGNEQKATKLYQLHKQVASRNGILMVNKICDARYDVIVDALFGIGLKREVTGEYAGYIDDICRIKTKYGTVIYSVDMPSGINTDTGKIMGRAVNADYTVTFGYKKRGVTFYPGCSCAGEVIIKDIGFARGVIDKLNDVAFSYDSSDIKNILPKRSDDSNKGTYGKVLIVSGSENMSGAAVLCTKAAVRAGAGLVKTFTVNDNKTVLQTSIPEALLRTYDYNNIEKMCEILKRELMWANVVLVGPGLTTSEYAVAIVKTIMENATIQVIADADALNIMSEYEDISYRPGTIITPHIKEMSRLCQKPVSFIKENIVSVAMDYANTHNVTVVLKDAKTVVTDGKKVYINSSGNNGMSKGGSGDVLAGIMAGLIAQSDNVYITTCGAVYIHGYAADEAVREHNCYALTPSDIIDNLRNVM